MKMQHKTDPTPGARLVLGAFLALAGLLPSGCATPEPAPPPPPAAPSDPNAPISLEYPRWETLEPGEQALYNRRANLIRRGREVYDKYCVGCHGEYGDGKGPAAERLQTQPRDFRRGVYKFRSTSSDSLPMEKDLYRTVTRGLAGVSMPAFPLMPHSDKLAVIEYIKTFYPYWDQDKAKRTLVHVPGAPQDLQDQQRIARGRVVYLEMECSKCHGIDGQGTGATQREFTDSWGNPQRAFNFTRGSLKSGNSPEDIYRTFHTGLVSIMPGYGGTVLAGVSRQSVARKSLPDGELERLGGVLGDFPETLEEVTNLSSAEQQRLAERNSWDLVAYILSLRQTRTTATAVLGGGQ